MIKTLLLLFLFFNVVLIKSIQNQEEAMIKKGLNEIYESNLIQTFNFGSTNPFSLSIYGDCLVIGIPDLNQLFVYRYNGTHLNSQINLTAPGTTKLGFSVSLYENVLAASDLQSHRVSFYRYNGTDWNYEGYRYESTGQFGNSVSVYKNVTVIGAAQGYSVFISRFNGTDWVSDGSFVGSYGSNLGYSVSVYENLFIAGAPDTKQALIYEYNGSAWNLNTTITQLSSQYFGTSVAISDGVLAVGAWGAKTVSIYRLNGTNWILEKTYSGGSITLGWRVLFFQDFLLAGTYFNSNAAFLYRYNGTNWNTEKTFSQSGYFGCPIGISENLIAVGIEGTSDVFVYEYHLSQVNIINCSSFFSSFDCYWDQPQLSNLKYQINYGFDWIDIESPNLLNGNVYYKEFDSYYANITGNEDYSIQIRDCDLISNTCGEPSSPSINLTTRIDSVQDFQLSNPTNDSVNISWNHPNVAVVEGIPHLDHYNISYFKQSEPGVIAYVSIYNSSISYLLNTLECITDYNISIWGCRTLECQGEDQGDVVESSISTIFGEVSDLYCSISNILEVNCSWNSPINCGIPSSYNFTYQATSQDDSGNSQQNSTNQNFSAQIPNQEYQINVSACDLNDKCGLISTISITTDNLTAPNINNLTSRIEEIEINFTKVPYSNNYSISLNDGIDWQNFTKLNLTGNEGIGTISGIGGNIQFNISVRGCTDLNCQTLYLGLPSSINSTKAILGNITSLVCESLIYGFQCTWDQLILSNGLQGYSFTYGSTNICLSKSITNFSVSGLIGGIYYPISIYSSANESCSFSEYSGFTSTTSITTLFPNQTKSSSSNTSIIVISVVVPIVAIIGIIIAIILIRKKRKSFKTILKQREKELEKTGGIEMI
ncbi:tenascin-r [Anaeramoeba ignava]|uniref:Tenascin-r n=1 Tax=Anaeramoeba ignava TaxID=1746090 RepID=A0A9Q0R5G1_ANAIG|nr:tenascin-r [Anaeramoeba ignava]